MSQVSLEAQKFEDGKAKYNLKKIWVTPSLVPARSIWDLILGPNAPKLFRTLKSN